MHIHVDNLWASKYLSLIFYDELAQRLFIHMDTCMHSFSCVKILWAMIDSFIFTSEWPIDFVTQEMSVHALAPPIP